LSREFITPTGRLGTLLFVLYSITSACEPQVGAMGEAWD